MHCTCCDKLLSDYEATMKNEETGVYLDMCSTCINESGLRKLIKIKERSDLSSVEEIEYED